MENHYKITEKQLVFLENYLLRKYPDISNEIRIELIDHLILDFEATTENGNLSQYLSDELGFIRKFVFDSVNNYQKKYGKETWQQFFSFFRDFKLLPITVFIFIAFYFLNENLNNKWTWGVLMIVQVVIFIASVFLGAIKNKKIRKLDEVKYLGSEIWLSYLLIHLPNSFEFDTFIMQHNSLFTFYASFTIVYALSAYIIVREKRKIILEKYKHLLN